MDLHKFPLDSQTCPLQIGSFGHDAHDIIYKVRFLHILPNFFLSFSIFDDLYSGAKYQRNWTSSKLHNTI